MKTILIIIIAVVSTSLILVTYFDNRYLRLNSDDGCFVGAFSADGRQVKIDNQPAGYEGYPIYKVCKIN